MAIWIIIQILFVGNINNQQPLTVIELFQRILEQLYTQL